MSVDLSNSIDAAKNRTKSIKTYNEVSADEKQLKKQKGNSLEKSIGKVSTQLNKISEQQKRFQRNVPTSMDSLFDLIFGTRGSGIDTVKYLRQKLLEVMVKMEPKVSEIITTESIKALGCSQEQTYPGIDKLQIPNIPSLPNSEGIYIPLNSIDFLGTLKTPANSLIGKFMYERVKIKPKGQSIDFIPQNLSAFKPYGGVNKVPMNKLLRERMDAGNFFSVPFREAYKGGDSRQNLIDFNYQTTNNFNVTGDYFRVFLINRENQNPQGLNDYRKNKVGQFLKDYYSSIKIIDPINVAATLVNYSTKFISIKTSVGYEKASDQSKFSLILQRINGLCFDSRREIDVSGISKIPELDGVDDSFFEFSEIDLRNIDETISNIKKGVITFEDCGTVELPVDVDSIINDFTNFSNSSATTVQDIVKNIENIIDNISTNPQWRLLIPNDVDIDLTINKDILKNLPVAVTYSILSPKVLFPIFLLIQVVEKSAINSVNQLIQSGNTIVQTGNSYLQSGTTVGQNVNNVITTPIDFLKKFKSFVIEVASKINAIFLEELYNILKKDIINLLSTVIKDVNKSSKNKIYGAILRLLQLYLAVSQVLNDFRHCKSLFDSVLQLLNLINSAGNQFGIKKNLIPIPLLELVPLLPGTSPERMAINVIENLDKLGIPTGRGPGNKANIMNQFMLQTLKGMDKENSENGRVEIMLDYTGILGYGKSL